jgi:N-acetyl-anhydromuramyl-L-alanine amidase AmpD
VALPRRRARVVVAMPTSHCSRRMPGSQIQAIVLHSTQGKNVPGPLDLRGLGQWFRDAPVSSHVATDADGTSGVYVNSKLKAWHCALFNSRTLGIEQVGFAEQNHWPTAQLLETARWIARWSRMYNIPIQLGAVHGTNITKRGIVTHKMLGTSGGGHVDPGPAYPMNKVLRYARAFKSRGR